MSPAPARTPATASKPKPRPEPTFAPPPRTGPALVAATRPFADDLPALSWWYVWTTLAIVVGALTVAALAPVWPVRLLASVFGGLVMVRVFILFHDYIHGAILRRSKLAKVILYACGGLLLAPPSAWRKNHNLHHTHMGKLHGDSAGGFPLMTVADWKKASRWTRLRYRVSRHPLVLAMAPFTIFLLAVAIEPLIEDWRKHWDAIPSILGHAAVVATLWLVGGFDVAFFAFILPYSIAAALGAYLFFVQHNFVGMQMLPDEAWTAEQAAIVSSSHLDLGRVLRWFTGDIGYHHVHHLNRTIPFYRLAEAMAAIPELQDTASTTTLHPRDILRSLRLSLYDEDRDALVSYREARLARAQAARRER